MDDFSSLSKAELIVFIQKLSKDLSQAQQKIALLEQEIARLRSEGAGEKADTSSLEDTLPDWIEANLPTSPENLMDDGIVWRINYVTGEDYPQADIDDRLLWETETAFAVAWAVFQGPLGRRELQDLQHNGDIALIGIDTLLWDLIAEWLYFLDNEGQGWLPRFLQYLEQDDPWYDTVRDLLEQWDVRPLWMWTLVTRIIYNDPDKLCDESANMILENYRSRHKPPSTSTPGYVIEVWISRSSESIQELIYRKAKPKDTTYIQVFFV